MAKHTDTELQRQITTISFFQQQVHLLIIIFVFQIVDVLIGALPLKEIAYQIHIFFQLVLTNTRYIVGHDILGEVYVQYTMITCSN